MDISVLKLPHPIPTCFNNEDSLFSCFGSLIEKQIDPQMWNLERETKWYKHSKRFLFQISSLYYRCTQSLWITFASVFYSEISRCCPGG